MTSSVMVSAHTAAPMRADRLLSILLLLQAHGRLSARSLAERLEVSERTVHRDMEALAMAGVPVWAQTGRNGGWALTDDYRTDLTGLTEAELRSLVVAGAPGVLSGLGLGEAFDRAITKVLATLPAARRETATAARGYLHVDPTGWRRTEDAAPWLPTLDDALRRGRRVTIEYERAYDRTVVERTVDPRRARRQGLGLVPGRRGRRRAADVPGVAHPPRRRPRRAQRPAGRPGPRGVLGRRPGVLPGGPADDRLGDALLAPRSSTASASAGASPGSSTRTRPAPTAGSPGASGPTRSRSRSSARSVSGRTARSSIRPTSPLASWPAPQAVVAARRRRRVSLPT